MESSCNLKDVIGQRIRQARESLHLTQKEFCQMTGMKLPSLRDYELGNRIPGGEALADLRRAKINADWLLSGFGDMFLDTENVSPGDNVARESAGAYRANLEGFILVPRYDVAGSMGGGAVIHSEQVVDHLAFKAEWVRTELGTSPANLVLISAVGDSMEPTLRAHDLLLIDRSVQSVKQDAIYAFAVDGELRIKRIQRLMDGSLVVTSDNPAYAAETLTAEQAARVNIVGRVVWSGRRM